MPLPETQPGQVPRLPELLQLRVEVNTSYQVSIPAHVTLGVCFTDVSVESIYTAAIFCRSSSVYDAAEYSKPLTHSLSIVEQKLPVKSCKTNHSKTGSTKTNLRSSSRGKGAEVTLSMTNG